MKLSVPPHIWLASFDIQAMLLPNAWPKAQEGRPVG
jgi:hypothetical protein